MSDWFSLVISAPVRTSVSDALPRVDSMRLASSSSLTEPSPRTCTASTKPGLATNSCAVGRSNSENVAPPGESASPKRAMPDSVNSRAPVAPAIWILSPTAKWPLFGAALVDGDLVTALRAGALRRSSTWPGRP